MSSPTVQRPHITGEIGVVLLLVFLYDRIRQTAATRSDQAIENGHRLLSVESWLHIDVERAVNIALSRHDMVELLSSWYYQLMHLSATLIVLLWIYWRRPLAYRAARNALVGINTVALAVFWVLPVAPPRLIPGAGFVDSAVVTRVAEKATTVSPDLYAAMPSLHVAWAAWVALQVLLVTRHRWGRGLAVAHALITSFIVISTANHYVLDIAAGAALAGVVVLWARRLVTRDVGCDHAAPPRDGRRPADRDLAEARIAPQRAYRESGPDRCDSSGAPGRDDLRAGAARSRAAGRRRDARLSGDPASATGLGAGDADGAA